MSLTCGILDGTYTAAQFADIGMHAFGNGICDYGGKFEVVARGANGVSVAGGFAIVGGYWIKSTGVTSIYVPYGEPAGGRYDAVVLRADLENRTAEIALVQGAASSDPVKYEPARNASRYELVLAHIYVTPAMTIISAASVTDTRSDIDLCGMIPPYSELSKGALTAYAYTQSGFQSGMAELRENTQAFGNALLSTIAAVSYRIGDLHTAAEIPASSEKWLLCDGGTVPEEYPGLITLIGETLPTITQADSRLKTWIYGGTPVY